MGGRAVVAGMPSSVRIVFGILLTTISATVRDVEMVLTVLREVECGGFAN